MSGRKKLIFHLGGHDFQPVADQVALMQAALGDSYWCHSAESLAAFEHLDECDLLVFVGMYFTGWEGRYRRPGETHQRRFEQYVTSGRPILLWHGAIASYDDWPRFRELTGFAFPAGRPTFALGGDYPIRIAPDSHPLNRGVLDHVLADSPPIGVRAAPDMHSRTHAWADTGDTSIALVMTGESGRAEGAGRTAFLGQGHTIHAVAHPVTRQIWVNAVRWCLGQE